MKLVPGALNLIVPKGMRFFEDRSRCESNAVTKIQKNHFCLSALAKLKKCGIVCIG